MQNTPTRRRFLRAGVAGTLGAGALVGGSRSVAAETVTLSGRVTAESGADVSNDEIDATSRDQYKEAQTRADGSFEVNVAANQSYKLGYYNNGMDIQDGDTRNGSPHIYSFGDYYVGSESKDLGTLTLPRAYPVNLRVLKPNGEPLMGARPDYRHDGWGASGRLLALNSEGYVVIDGAEFPGLEFAENVTAEIKPPAGDEYEDTTYKRSVAIDGPTEIVATIDSSSASWQVNRGEDAVVGGEGTTSEPTSGTTNRGTTPESTTGSPTTREVPATATTSRGTQRGNRTNATKTTTTESKRGFFSNGPGKSDLEMLNDPFVLTVGGFVLSAAGIVHQLVRGY